MFFGLCKVAVSEEPTRPRTTPIVRLSGRKHATKRIPDGVLEEPGPILKGRHEGTIARFGVRRAARGVETKHDLMENVRRKMALLNDDIAVMTPCEDLQTLFQLTSAKLLIPQKHDFEGFIGTSAEVLEFHVNRTHVILDIWGKMQSQVRDDHACGVLPGLCDRIDPAIHELIPGPCASHNLGRAANVCGYDMADLMGIVPGDGHPGSKVLEILTQSVVPIFW